MYGEESRMVGMFQDVTGVKLCCGGREVCGWCSVAGVVSGSCWQDSVVWVCVCVNGLLVGLECYG